MSGSIVGAVRNKVVSVEPVSRTRKRVALVLAGVADAVQLGFFPMFGEGALSIPDDALDVLVALALLLTLGFRWRLLLSLAFELVPGATLFPTWTAMVLTLPSTDTKALEPKK